MALVSRAFRASSRTGKHQSPRSDWYSSLSTYRRKSQHWSSSLVRPEMAISILGWMTAPLPLAPGKPMKVQSESN